MISIIQRVSCASVSVEAAVIAKIDHGLLALIAIEPEDADNQVQHMAHRLLHYRMFPDDSGKMNLNVMQVAGELLLVPQFTLTAKTDKGLRPNFSGAAAPEVAEARFDALYQSVQEQYAKVQIGQFGANMAVNLTNDGPVTFTLYSR